MDAHLPRVREQNNFDFLRFLAASSVILSHSFTLTTGDATREPLHWLSAGQTSFGHLAVAIFFVASGLLITRSYERTRSVVAFTQARALRILPGLAAALMLTVLVVGPLVTTYSSAAYWSDPGTYRYLEGITMARIQYTLPGVFTGNPYPNAVNGSLWTLWFEVQCYMVVAVLGVAGVLKRGVVVSLIAAAGIALPFSAGAMAQRAELFLFFGGGMCLHLFRDRIRVSGRAAAASAVLLVASVLLGHGFAYAFALCGSYLVYCAAYADWGRLARFGRHGDVSYGVYIYAFPVQQTLIQLAGGHMHWLTNTVLSFAITLLLAFASWRWVEKPALALKDRSLVPARWRNRAGAPAGAVRPGLN